MAVPFHRLRDEFKCLGNAIFDKLFPIENRGEGTGSMAREFNRYDAAKE